MLSISEYIFIFSPSKYEPPSWRFQHKPKLWGLCVCYKPLLIAHYFHFLSQWICRKPCNPSLYVIYAPFIFGAGVRLKGDKERKKERCMCISPSLSDIIGNYLSLLPFFPFLIRCLFSEAHGLNASQTIVNILKRAKLFSPGHVVSHTAEHEIQNRQLPFSLSELPTTDSCQWNLQGRGQGQHYVLLPCLP